MSRNFEWAIQIPNYNGQYGVWNKGIDLLVSFKGDKVSGELFKEFFKAIPTLNC